jgi:AraC family transcriptional regulator
MLILRPAGETHAHHFHNKGSRCFVIEIEKGWLDRLRGHRGVLDDSTQFYGGLSVWLATRLYNEFHRADEASSLAIEGLMFEMIAEASRHPVKASERKGPGWVKHTEEFLKASFRDPLTLDGIAGSVGIHPIHLSRVFKLHYGCTIGEYVRKLRIEFACREISQTDTPLTEIALAAGFYDQSHFSRTFKRIVGLTPGEYRVAFRPR